MPEMGCSNLEHGRARLASTCPMHARLCAWTGVLPVHPTKATVVARLASARSVDKKSDHKSDNDSHYSPNDNMGDLNDMLINVIQMMGAIWIPPTTRRIVFHITGTIIQLFQMKGIFGGLAHEDPLEYLRNFKKVNKGVADQLVQGGLMRQSYDVVVLLLDGMTKVKQA
uniref:Uncharacterized protein n=1 Tax=Solanum tuberosum TaxID=4113 RepID=M1DUG7_SOLTU